MSHQRLGQVISGASNLPHVIGRRRRYVGIQLQIRDGQTMIAANPGDSAVVVIVIVDVAAVVERIVVVDCVTTLLRALQTIVILFGNVTARC